MSWVDYVGFLAALTVLATFCMDTILPLRGLAIASNLLFIVYGTAGQLYPVLLLHALLLPINISKIVQLVRKNRLTRVLPSVARVQRGQDRRLRSILREGGHAELTEGISSCRSAHWRESLADLHRWLQHVNRGNVRVERHDPGSDDQANPGS